MNVMFLSLSSNVDLNDSTIYGSVLSELIKNKCNVFIVSPNERKNKEKTYLIEKDNYKLLKVKTGNIQKTNIIEKGISTILIQSQFKRAIKKYFNGVKFDLILYATPPITFCNIIKCIKRRDNARTYLMLKDIFPQNAVDLNIFSKKSIFYKYFRKKEIELYKVSDRIGCMSSKNKEYLIEHNNYLDENKIEVFPNSINPKKENIRNLKLNDKYRKKYNIPLEARVFMYGGNLGKPQDIPFIIECLDKVKDIDNVYFVICGSGTEYKKLVEFKKKSNISNLLLLNGLPKKEYDELLNIADVGLIFLDYNFTIPNFPSRLLSYMEKGIPVLSCTDPNTDIGDIIEKNNFGWKCYSNNSLIFRKLLESICKLEKSKLIMFGNNSLNYLKANYQSNRNIGQIIQKDNKIRLLILTTVLAPYRVELFNEISSYDDIDLSVCFEQKKDAVRNSKWYNYETKFNTVILKKANKSLKYIKYEFFKILRHRNEYDMVIFYEPSTYTASLAIEYCIFHKIKYMLNCDGAILQDKENSIKKFIKIRNIKNASGLIANGKSARAYYLHYGALENKIYSHHFSNLKSSDILVNPLSNMKKDRLKKELGLDFKHLYLSVGNFVTNKGFDLLLKSIKKFNLETKEYMDYGFVIVGSGVQKEQYEQYIKDNKMNNVIIKDFMKKQELINYYDSANYFILLTRTDVWGLVIHEAMARGLPVICTNKCNAALELIENEKTGYIINLDDNENDIISNTCNCIKKIVYSFDMDVCKRILENAKNYTIEKSAAEHIEIVRKVDEYL